MYSSFRQLCERLLRIPHDPSPPPGDETSTRIFRAAPNYYRYLLCLWALKTAFLLVIELAVFLPLVIAGFSLAAHGNPWAILLALFALLLLLVIGVGVSLFHLAIVRLEFEKRWYVITDRSLRVREGVVSVKEMTVNFANIQNISISQGPIQRMLGIADLKVDTAGGGGSGGNVHEQHAQENLHTAWFRGVNNANEVRELIQQRLSQLKDAGLGDHEEVVARATAGAAPDVAFNVSPGFLAALREVHAEVRALRNLVE